MESSGAQQIRNFLWRIVKNILPVRVNLRKKGINLDLKCPICHKHDEDVEHLFMHCHSTKATWFCSSMGIHIPPSVNLGD